MLTVSEALSQVLAQARALQAERCALGPDALGLVLAEDVPSDLDMPPYDKALMDGYALRTADLAEGRGQLLVIEEITAGRTPQRNVGSGQASRIMTGAPIPAGADAVVRVERTQLIDSATVQIDDSALKPGGSIQPRASEMNRGEIVLKSGTVLRPPELGLLAAVGRTSVQAIPAPTVAILSTGDELVEAELIPGPGQIRNSNGPLLVAKVSRAGGRPRALGIAADEVNNLRGLIQEGLRCDMLVLSGGVSAGKLDLVPGVLQELGVQAHFHKVEMKPGKPVFFGSRVRESKSATLVFGLPGNPVSSLVCFELFVRPALNKLSGRNDPGPRMVQATLAEDYRYSTDRPTYHPAWLSDSEEVRVVRPRPWLGSPDLRSITQANAFIVFQPGEQQHRAGQRYPVIIMDESG